MGTVQSVLKKRAHMTFRRWKRVESIFPSLAAMIDVWASADVSFYSSWMTPSPIPPPVSGLASGLQDSTDCNVGQDFL